MAYLSAVSSLDNVIQYEIDDPTQTIGGPGGGANAQAQALLNRTKYIYDNFFNRLTQTLDNIGDGTSYARLQKAKADKINAGTYSEDDIADGTSYKRVLAAEVTALRATSGSTPWTVPTLFFRDTYRAQVEAASGGQNTVLYDDLS